ncbi:MAG: class II aldolase/adducin family protein [Burkholderiales bacterium]|jgi:L-fuculose-phosphate aldolase|nr:class II aldolase/adducin family protein [Burkholderiales bacterium]
MTAPTLPEDSPALRAQAIATARASNATGINVNKAGNVSVRCMRGAQAGFIITPSAVPYDALTPEALVFVRVGDGRAQGRRRASSEWRFHRDLYAARPELAAIVHTHSPHATALACHGRGIPAFHYMVAQAGGADIRCAPYATFGTPELADAAVTAMAGRRACLLAHHGVIACGATLDAALALAIEVEHLARIYLLALQVGEPPVLDAAEMTRVIERFGSYGRA